MLGGLESNIVKNHWQDKIKGMHPNAPITALMSPKKGNIAARVVAMITDNERRISLGTTLRIEN